MVEAHFHFFVMIGVTTLYQDWLPFGLALAYVVVHHTVVGVLAPAQVFNHPAAERAPFKWALIHGAFVVAASVAYLVNWRLSERQAVEISRLVSRLEGLARTDPLTGVLQPAGVGGGAAPRAGAGPADRGRAVPGHDRPGRLQGLQRLLRPPGRATGCSRRRPAPGGPRSAPPTCWPATAARSSWSCCRRVRWRTPSGSSSACGPSPPGHLLGRAGLLELPEGCVRPGRPADQALYAAKPRGRKRYVLAS